MTDPEPSYPDVKQLVLLNAEISRRSEAQFELVESFDRKGTTTLAGNGVLLGLTLNHADDFQGVMGWSPGMFFAALVLLGLGVFAGVAELWLRRWKVVPEPGEFAKLYYGKTREETLAQLISVRIEAFKINDPRLDRKANVLRIQMGLLAAGASLLVAAYLVKELVK